MAGNLPHVDVAQNAADHARSFCPHHARKGMWHTSTVLTEGVLLITGIMASGKSTVADLLARQLPVAAHVRGDLFRRMIVSGGTVPTPDDPGRDQLTLRYDISASVADQYAAAGIPAIVQDIVIGPDLGDYVQRVRQRPLYVVVLAPSASAVATREEGRSKSGYGEWTVDDLDAALRTQTPRLGLWLDTSELTPAETVDCILSRLSEARVGV
jgi:hypothetical protein